MKKLFTWIALAGFALSASAQNTMPRVPLADAPTLVPALPATPPPAATAPRQAVPRQTPPRVAAPTAPSAPAPAGAARQGTPAIVQEVKLDGRNVKLERIRIQRAKNFARLAPDEEEEAAAWNSEMGFQIRVTPPQNWDIVAINEAGILQVLDQRGQPLPGIKAVGSLSATSPAPNLNPMEPLFKRVDNGAIMLLLRTTAPPTTTQTFKELNCRIKLMLGLRKNILIQDLKTQIGRPILHDSGLDDLAMQINDISTDGIDVIALGELNRIGTIEFTDASGKAIRPYNSEVTVKDADKKGEQQAKVWHFAFSNLPPKVNMHLAIYPVLMPRSLMVKFPDVPLP